MMMAACLTKEKIRERNQLMIKTPNGIFSFESEGNQPPLARPVTPADVLMLLYGLSIMWSIRCMPESFRSHWKLSRLISLIGLWVHPLRGSEAYRINLRAPVQITRGQKPFIRSQGLHE